MKLITTEETCEMDIYEFVKNIVNTDYTQVYIEDRMDMIQDAYLYLHDYYLRNMHKSYMPYKAHQQICQYCNRWLKTHTSNTIPLDEARLVCEINYTNIIYKELVKGLNDKTPLEPYDAQVIEYYFMEWYTMDAISAKMHIPRNCVNQIIKKALRKYRNAYIRLQIRDLDF